MNQTPSDKHAIAQAWISLFEELQAWSAAGQRAPLWWRDDDAQRVTTPFRRLIELSELHKIPLLLAVIPEGISSELSDRIAMSDAPVAIGQHGIAHRNNAPADSKKTELYDDMLADENFVTSVLSGRQTLSEQFGSRFLSIMIPPWNRIGPQIASRLIQWGYVGLSVDGPPRFDAGGLIQVNTEIDLIDWRGGKKFIGPEKALTMLTDRLAKRRSDAPQNGQSVRPIGLLTHHLDHDRALWAFLSQLFGLLGGHTAIHWADPVELFATS